jgi:hypothetical protein
MTTQLTPLPRASAPITGSGILPARRHRRPARNLGEGGTLTADTRALPRPLGEVPCGFEETCPAERIIELPEAPALEKDDALVIDHASRGTRQVSFETITQAVLEQATTPRRYVLHWLPTGDGKGGHKATIDVGTTGPLVIQVLEGATLSPVLAYSTRSGTQVDIHWSSPIPPGTEAWFADVVA